VTTVSNLAPPVGPGNELALKHGATATLRLAPRAAAIAEGLRAIVPARTESDEPSLRILALVLARVEVANEWLAENGLFRGKGEPQPILKVLSTWENTAARMADRLGLTPTSRAALGLDVARARGEAARAHIASTYGKAMPDPRTAG